MLCVAGCLLMASAQDEAGQVTGVRWAGVVSDIEGRGIVSVQSVVDSVGARISAVSPTVVGNETSILDSHDPHHTSTTSLASHSTPAQYAHIGHITSQFSRDNSRPHIANSHGHSHVTSASTNSLFHARFHVTVAPTTSLSRTRSSE